MAKKIKQRGEKLGEILGRRRPVEGAIFIFIGAILALAMLDYVPGQEVFFKPYLESFFYSTTSAGTNLCGKFGATFCVLAYISIGFAAFMIPVYCVWVGILLLQRRANGIGRGNILAIVCGLFLLSILSAIMQGGIQDSGTPTATFPSGWGGKFGTVVFDSFLKPFLDVIGSSLLVGSLYLFCLIVVFVDSPIEAAKELAGVAKKSPSVFMRVCKILWAVVAFFPRLLAAGFAARKNEDENDSAREAEFLNSGKRVKNSTRPRSEPPSYENFEASSHDYSDDDSASESEPRPEPVESQNSPEPEVGLEDSAAKEFSPIIFDSSADNVQAPIKDFSSRFGDDDEFDSIFAASPENAEDKDSKPAEIVPEEDLRMDVSGGDLSKGPGKETSEDASTEALPSKLKVDTYVPEKYTLKEKQQKRGNYIFPSIDLLRPAKHDPQGDADDYEARMAEIIDCIGSFSIKVLPSKAMPGPVITRYEVVPAPGVRINRIAALEDDIALGIRAKKVRVIAPIPGTGTVGIEVPNVRRQMVCMRDIIESKEWNESKAEIPIALGKDVTGVPIVLDLTKMPHALIAGSTGSGKSVCMNSIIASLVYKTTPDDLRFIMVDPKVVELQVYNSLPHMLVPVVTDPKKVPAALKWLISEMMRRYQIFKEVKVRNIAGFNAKILKDKEESEKAAALDKELTPEERQAAAMAEIESQSDDSEEIEIPIKKLPYIVCIIDELADLMMVAGKEVEASIARLTQLARAAGIHLLVATQRPSTDVITGLIKSNLPTRIAFRVSSQIDSRTIIDKKGAETLIGNGDMLYTTTSSPDPVRAQGAFMSDDEINDIVEALKVNGEPEFVDEIQAQIDSAGDDEDSDDSGEGGEYDDPMTAKAIGVIRATRKASTSLLQRKLGIGYGRAARIIDELEERGVIGPDKGQGSRDIFVD